MKLKFFTTLILVFSFLTGTNAQSFVTWPTGVGSATATSSGTNATRQMLGSSTITGTVNLGGSTGLVTVTATASVNTSTGWTYQLPGFTNVIWSSDNYGAYGIANGSANTTTSLGASNINQWFWSYKHIGPYSTPPNIITFSFNKDVVISEFGIADVTASGNAHNESFTISGYTFSSQVNNFTVGGGVTPVYTYNPAATVTNNSVNLPANTYSSMTDIGVQYVKFYGTSVLPAGTNLVLTYNGKAPTATSGVPANNNVWDAYAIKLAPPPCIAGTTAPVLNTTTNFSPNIYTIPCGSTTANLTGITATTTLATLAWFSSSTPSTANRITATTTPSLSALPVGTYYAAFYDATNSCYSPVTAVTVTKANCLQAVNDPFGSYMKGILNTTPSVLANDYYDTAVAATTSNVNLTWNTTAPAGITLNANGTIAIGILAAATTYNINYTICDKLVPANCKTATATFTVTDCRAGTSAPVVNE